MLITTHYLCLTWRCTLIMRVWFVGRTPLFWILLHLQSCIITRLITLWIAPKMDRPCPSIACVTFRMQLRIAHYWQTASSYMCVYSSRDNFENVSGGSTLLFEGEAAVPWLALLRALLLWRSQIVDFLLKVLSRSYLISFSQACVIAK